MDIDDILEKSEFKKLDDFLTAEMKKTAGNDLVLKIEKTLESPKEARDWFYSYISALGGQRPYDYCRDGRKEEIENILLEIEYGMY